MKHDEGNFAHPNGQSLYYQYWLPEGKVKASIFIVHGLNEHSGRYQHLARILTAQEYAVYGLDFPGHGRSDGVRSYVDSYNDFNESMESYLDMIKDWQSGAPLFLLGHSMGGLLATVYLADHPDQIKGAILSASLAKVPEYVSDFTLEMGKILSAILPKFRLIEFDKEGLSQDPAVVQAYYDDPLVYTGKSTVRISNELNYGINQIEDRGSQIKQPLLILHGGADRICDPSWSQYLHDLVSSTDKKLVIYDGFYHEIINEPEADQVFKDILNWLDEHVE
jgi:alpha-beta hydrolase superfamily lysophospholipase